MRLSKIKLAGFKSFVDPTSLLLPANLTGVVGPNGCGKSNIIDAVRWVMGESSAKHLRGDSMADVIFNGSSSRKPVGQAMIELVFDNSDGTIGGQYASYSEISIRRTVTRDGQSQYHLNGTRCRRRDITDIFLGTGLGPRSYAIIEQGTISRLIEARPEDLRIFLEEAAGISKYKERRRETENRIRHTRDNLDRLNDLREELTKQLAKLERQARTAERYRELKAQERTRSGQLQALRWQQLAAELATQQATISDLERAAAQRLAAQRHAERALIQLREDQAAATEAFNRVQADFYGVGAEIARLEQALQHGRERRGQQHDELIALDERYQREAQQQQQDREQLAMLAQQLTALQPEQELAAEAAELADEALAEAEEALLVWQEQWQHYTEAAALPARAAEVERTRIEQLEGRYRQVGQRRQRLQQERDLLDGSALQAECQQLQQQLTAIAQEVATAEQQVSLSGAAISAQRQQLAEQQQQLDQLRTERQQAHGRYASLQALQQAAQGESSAPSASWLQQQQLTTAPRLLQQLTVTPGWESALEMVLGEALQAFCVTTLTAPLLTQSAALTEGRLMLVAVPTDRPAAAVSSAVAAGGAPPLLAAQVTGPYPTALLAGVRCVASIEEALAWLPQLPATESLITNDGIWLSHHWLRLARDADPRRGVVAREQALRTLQQQLAAIETAATTTLQQLDSEQQQLAAIEQQRDADQQQLAAWQRQQGQLQQQLTTRHGRLEQIQQRQQQLDGELAELAEEQMLTGDTLDEAQRRLHQALSEVDQLNEQREALTGDRDLLRDTVDTQRHTAREATARAQQLALQQQRLVSEQQATEQALQRLTQQLTELAQRRQQLAVAVESAAEPLALLAEQLDEQLDRRLRLEQQLSAVRQQLEQLMQAQRTHEVGRSEAEQEGEQLRGQLDQVRMARQESQIRQQTISERLQEQGEPPITELLSTLPATATAADLELQLTELVGQINRLGAINLAAIEEFQQQQERKHYLDSQYSDLVTALETLENAIRKIDRETRQRFRDTFDRVNAGLQAKFPRLFGGGSAYLELTGDDLLDTGVTVMARPPGKRNSTIHLLSGGEKALTAVALVFAIFELNPSPFCMLDEVDAPLDEANVGRFCELVREMSKQVQFIFITHNKVTMELADHLAGVTMHEPGVSRLVAVDVAAAVELAAI